MSSILDYAMAQRIGGADGELVEELCNEIEQLRAELEAVKQDRDELLHQMTRIAQSRVVDIAQAALAKLGDDKTGEVAKSDLSDIGLVGLP